jgi:uncharacterized protein YkwD
MIFSSNIMAQSLTTEEKKLYQLVMEYRKSLGLPNIPLSNNLNKVAQTHVQDLQKFGNPFDKNCNLHSWSKNGSWTSCCYTADHSQKECMYQKPREISKYQGNGYEIAYYFSDLVTAEMALENWKKSPGHLAVIANSGIWKNIRWNAIGIAIYKNYSVIWFGMEEDTFQ